MKANVYIAVFFPLILLLAGCGFHLRGQVNLPEGAEPIYIGGVEPSTPLSIELYNLLSSYGVTLTANIPDANHQLIILEQKQDRRTMALDARARASEYQLLETVKFELRNKKGQTVLGPSTITERRIMPNDPNRVVSTGEEEKLLRREMLQNIAAKIARQLRSFKFTPAQATTS